MANEKVIPTQDYVLLEQLPPGRTPGGIIIPDVAKGDLPRCRILDVGPDVADLKAGDLCLADCRDGYNVRKGVALVKRTGIISRIELADVSIVEVLQ